MQPYYVAEDKKKLNAVNVNGFGYRPDSQKGHFMFPNPINAPLQRGFYPPNVRPPMMYYDGNAQAPRHNLAAGTEDPRQQKAMMEKLMKERNYQLQQKRLRDFNPSQGAKLKADKLIENVMGSFGVEQTSGKDLGGVKTVKDTKNFSLGSTSAEKFGNRARDWSNVGDLEQVFASNLSEGGSELPLWCRAGSSTVPAFYLEVERCVTREGKIDTGLVYPILLSSGLSRETLGRLWALVNRETPGILARSELYAVLAMIGLVQNAREVFSISVLNTLTHPPIPLFNVSNNYTAQQTPTTVIQPPQTQAPVVTNNFDDFDDFQSAVVEPPSAPVENISSASVGSRLANYDLTFPQPRAVTEPSESVSHKKVQVDLMESTEDKYSIFRFIEAPPTTSKTPVDFDEFGGFMSNTVLQAPAPGPAFGDDFDEFQGHIPSLPTTIPRESVTIPNFSVLEFPPEEEDDEFGDFAAADTVLGGEDSVSMPVALGSKSEVQSVASLDLGVVDTRSDTPPAVDVKPEMVLDLTASLTDRYSFLKRETESSQDNCHAYEWRRCLENCFQLIRNALDVFNGGSSSGVCHEVISCEEGENFIKSLIEIYRVAGRISRWISFVRGEEARALETTVNSIEDEWNRLLPFIVASPVVPSEGKSGLSKRNPTDQTASKPCGVCLMDVERCDNDCAPHINLAQLTYSGRMYHATCANFWVNCVDSKLPSLPVLF